jgi:molybdopterin/thiamine biosynthesis adenylyltransferase
LNEFSAIDDEGEEALAEFLRYRLPDAVHAAMLITPEKYLARQLGRNEALKIIGVGPEIHSELSPVHSENSERFDRQIRAFGRAGQDTLRGMRVGVVGLGGTGSVVLQELCYLGVKNFLLIDPDIVELSNLNRLAGATPDSVGRAKVDVARRWSLQICPDAQVEAVQDSVLKASVARTLADTDFVFSCTDSHGSRAVLNQLSYQYLVPLIDMGVVIATQKRQITHVAARTQMLAPGLACMVCGNLLDPEEVRRDLLTDFERKADPYIIGHTEPAPAVISLNATIASLAITMFLNAVTGIPGSARFLNYDAIRGFCRPAYCTPHPSCVVCSLQGALARSDEWPLPARID